MYRKYFKRPLDVVLSLLAIIVLSPVFITIAILVRVKLDSPVIFKQIRPGLNEVIFTMYKFRTMTNERDNNGNLLPDSMRLNKFGKSLRATSLDELPELINIIKGDMSIIGPRPQLVRDMVFMTKEQRNRHKVRPGLSGLAQVHGRNAISWDKKLAMDLEYMQHITFSGDVKIILLTVKKILYREDISAKCMTTAEDYGDYLIRTGVVSQEEYKKKQKEAKEIVDTERW
ncbi:MAG: sugar transferase [Porphyromonadaceae bacterium]|nr:sugar transferase [Porphyromonadaceae bacterium]